MRPCLNLTTLMRTELEDAVAAAAEAGFGAVEIWVESLEKYLETHTADDVVGLLRTHGIGVSTIGDIESITFCNAEQFEELMRRCGHLASVARAISCPTLVVSASVRPRDVDDERVAEETVSVIGKLLDIVEPKGVNLALAFRAFEWCAVNSLEQVLEAIDHHGGRRIGLALDTFDLHASGVQPDTLKSFDPSQIFIARLSDSENVPRSILSDADRVLPGEGCAQLDAMLAALAETGYAGDVSLKILSQRLWGIAATEAAQIIMAVTKKYLPGARLEMETEK